MEKLRKSGRARILAVATTALAVGALASLAATGYAARLVAFTHTSPQAAQYPPSKVTICHHTHSQKNPFVTITVSEHAVPAHLKHGDTVGPCSPEAPSTPGAPAKQQKTQKTHKAHPSKHSGNKGQLHGHGKPTKTTPAAKTHGQGNGVQGPSDAPTTVHGKGHAKNKGHVQSHGQAKGHDKTHGQGQGSGQGQGHGQGQGGTHGNSGGGKGNGKKP